MRDHTKGSGALGAQTRFGTIAELWLADLDLAPGTLRQYRRSLDNRVLPGLGALRLSELTVGRVHDFLQAVAKGTGVETAKTARTVTSGVCSWAVVRDLIDRNPVRDAGRLSGGRKRPVDALSVAEVQTLRTRLKDDPVAFRNGIERLVSFMLATSLRLSEALAVRWRDVDLDAGTVAVTGSLVWVVARGVMRQEQDSRRLTTRILTLHSWIVAEMRGWPRSVGDAPLFASERGGWLDDCNTQKRLRAAFDRAGFPRLTSHGLRRSVASLLDASELGATVAAHQLEHARISTTQAHYVARRVSPRAAEVLESFGI